VLQSNYSYNGVVLSVNYRYIIGGYRKWLWCSLYYSVSLVLLEVTVGHMAYDKLYAKEYLFPDKSVNFSVYLSSLYRKSPTFSRSTIDPMLSPEVIPTTKLSHSVSSTVLNNPGRYVLKSFCSADISCKSSIYTFLLFPSLLSINIIIFLL